jgi:alpha-tubulin suppressor-like RCC1 family protein
VTKDKTLYCWGVNGIYGRLGIGDAPDQPSPKVVSLTNVDQVSAGYEHTCAVRGGAQYCWGNGYQGQLGIDGEFTWRTAPTDASALPSAMFVSAGFQSTASVTQDGKAYMSSTGVRLGNGTTDSTYVPVGLDLSDVREIAAGSSHTCALASKQGLLWCWGDNTQGQIGGGSLGGAEVLSPQPVVFVF